MQVCDFGLARFFRPYVDEYTPRVVTLWYRCVCCAYVMLQHACICSVADDPWQNPPL